MVQPADGLRQFWICGTCAGGIIRKPAACGKFNNAACVRPIETVGPCSSRAGFL